MFNFRHTRMLSSCTTPMTSQAIVSYFSNPKPINFHAIYERECNTPDVIYLICIPTLVVSGLSYFIFSVVGFLSPLCCCLCHASHIMSSCALHLHTCSFHASEHFPHCPFCIPSLLCPPVVLSTYFRVCGLNISGLDRDLPCSLGLLPVVLLSSFCQLDFV